MKLIWLQLVPALTLFLQLTPIIGDHYDPKRNNDEYSSDYEDDVEGAIITDLDDDSLLRDFFNIQTANSRLGDGNKSALNDDLNVLINSDDSKIGTEELEVGNYEPSYFLDTPSKTDLSIGVLDNDALSVGIIHKDRYILVPDLRNSSNIYRLGRMIKQFDSSEYEYNYDDYEAESNTKTTPKPKFKPKPGPGWMPKPTLRPRVTLKPRPTLKPRVTLKPKPTLRPRPSLKPRPTFRPRPNVKPRLKLKSGLVSRDRKLMKPNTRLNRKGIQELNFGSIQKGRVRPRGLNVGGELNIFGKAELDFNPFKIFFG